MRETVRSIGGSMADDWEWQISQLSERIDYLESEMERRDAWLINAVWNVMRNLDRLARNLIVFGVVVFGEFFLWWQLLIAFAIVSAWGWFDFNRAMKLEAEDKVRIARQ